MFLGPLDPVLAVLYGALRLKSLRVVLLTLGLVPAVLYALPPQPCGCLPMLFVRCSGGGRALAYRAAMKSDLKNLASQQEIYFSDYEQYSADFTDLAFVSSNGVQVTVVAAADGWSARATHAAMGEAESCAIYVGDAAAHAKGELAGAEAGAPVCTPSR